MERLIEGNCLYATLQHPFLKGFTWHYQQQSIYIFSLENGYDLTWWLHENKSPDFPNTFCVRLASLRGWIKCDVAGKLGRRERKVLMNGSSSSWDLNFLPSRHHPKIVCGVVPEINGVMLERCIVFHFMWLHCILYRHTYTSQILWFFWLWTNECMKSV